MPIHEGSVRIVLPCPDMECVERGEPEAVGGLEVVEELTHQLGRALVLLVPCVGEYDEVRADETKRAVRLRFVNHDSRLRWVQQVLRQDLPLT